MLSDQNQNPPQTVTLAKNRINHLRSLDSSVRISRYEITTKTVFADVLPINRTPQIVVKIAAKRRFLLLFHKSGKIPFVYSGDLYIVERLAPVCHRPTRMQNGLLYTAALTPNPAYAPYRLALPALTPRSCF